MGRTGEMFAADTFGVVPDLICLGKGISGGYMPLSAVLCQRQIADKFWGDKTINPGFVSGHTYEANPIACVLDWQRLEKLLKRTYAQILEKLAIIYAKAWRAFANMELSGTFVERDYF